MAMPEEASDSPEPISQRPLLEEQPLARRIDPGHARWPLLILFLSTLLSAWHWQIGHQNDLVASRALIENGEYWRLLVSPLVHADIAHLLANAGLFLVFGVLLRNYFGWMMFPVLSLLGGWATEILALLTYEPQVRLLGASGMVYFMVGLWLLLFGRYANYLSLL